MERERERDREEEMKRRRYIDHQKFRLMEYQQ
jgi:hypothetical protein